MSRATEQEAYELLKNWISLFKKSIILRLRQSKMSLFPTWSASKKSIIEIKKRKKIYLVILPDEKHADLKQLAEQLKEKRLSFVSEEQLPDLLGVPAGTVTPLALMHDKEKKSKS